MVALDGVWTRGLSVEIGKGLRMRKALLLGAVALLATTGMARADGPNMIELRQTSLDLMGGDYAAIRFVAGAKGDMKSVESAAKAIKRFATLMPSLFPKGSETGGDTKALPAIWSDNAGFVKAAETLAEAADKLAVLAKAGDADGVDAQIKVVGAACGACHKDYRAK